MTSQFLPLLPEITLAIGACVVLVVDLFVPPERRDTTYVLALAALIATLVAVVVGQPDGVRILFGGSYIADPMSLLLKLAVIVLTFFVFIY
jgi:NADH-quinone oxidoreductase subunit N